MYVLLVKDYQVLFYGGCESVVDSDKMMIIFQLGLVFMLRLSLIVNLRIIVVVVDIVVEVIIILDKVY